MSAAVGWTVLALVFLDELLAVTAGWVWGRHAGGVLLAVVAAIAVVVVWSLVASPKARFGGPVARPLGKVLVFGLGATGLWAAGHHAWALWFLAFSVVINALALLPSVRALVEPAD
jgi:hypothetical protein